VDAKGVISVGGLERLARRDEGEVRSEKKVTQGFNREKEGGVTHIRKTLGTQKKERTGAGAKEF